MLGMPSTVYRRMGVQCLLPGVATKKQILRWATPASAGSERQQAENVILNPAGAGEGSAFFAARTSWVLVPGGGIRISRLGAECGMESL